MYNINEKGVTLLEALVSVILMLIVLLGLYQVMDENMKVFKAQQELTHMNTQVRTAMEQIVRSIRSAGSNKTALAGAPMIYYAQPDQIRVLSDLPYDWHAGGDTANMNAYAGGDGDSFDYIDGTDADTAKGTEGSDNENENGDELINDPGEDVTFMLVDDGDGVAPHTLIKVLFSDIPYPLETGDPPDIPALTITQPNSSDEILAENIISLSFSYFDKDGNALTTFPLSVEDLTLVDKVTVKILAQTKNVDRRSGLYHTTEIVSDVDIRNK